MSPDPSSDGATELQRHGLVAVRGAEARQFLHSQLTSDVQHLGPAEARVAGWCSPKGRLLASFLVVPADDGLLLVLARELAPAVAKRLGMFVLRAKAKVSDESPGWHAYGAWGAGAVARLAAAGLPVPTAAMTLVAQGEARVVAVATDRFLVLSRTPLESLQGPGSADDWTLAEIREGRPLITLATQDQFVPQMANFERIGGVDFKKGCYPGQEIVARTQYRGILKRRMYRIEADEPLADGQALYSDDFPDQASGMVVNAVGREGLAVLQIGSVEKAQPVRLRAGGLPVRVALPPYSL